MKWTNWIHECFSTTQMSILVNGSHSKPFAMERDVRQGDSMSPFLSLIMVEGFKCLLDKVVELGLVDGVFIFGSFLALSLLQFNDDTLIFLSVDIENLEIL